MKQPPYPVQDNATRLRRLRAWFLDWFFRRLYTTFAWGYDWVAAVVSLGMWKDWVLSVRGDLHGPAILELGHGPGHLLLALRQSGLAVVGLDYSLQMGVLAFGRLQGFGLIPLLVNGYAQNMPFPSGWFQTVVATFPTDYLWEPRTLQEIYRVLSPGGSLVILPTAWITGNGPIERLLAWLFTITGQAPCVGDQSSILPLTNRLAQIGFLVQTEIRPHKSSQLLVIHGLKPL